MADKKSNIKKAIGQIEAKVLRLEYQKAVYERMLEELSERPAHEKAVPKKATIPGRRPGAQSVITVVDSLLEKASMESDPTRFILVRSEREKDLAYFKSNARADELLRDEVIFPLYAWMVLEPSDKGGDFLRINVRPDLLDDDRFWSAMNRAEDHLKV